MNRISVATALLFSLAFVNWGTSSPGPAYAVARGGPVPRTAPAFAKALAGRRGFSEGWPAGRAQGAPSLQSPITSTSQNPSPAPFSRFELTVDSIMRGPDLVGYPPTGLRWSADSQKLYFEWRRPGEREASTYVVSRAGGEPQKLSDGDAKTIPPATAGRWDAAHRRVLFVDDGDIVLVDSISGTRRQITRTTAAESNPRWARNDSHVTHVRDGNLFDVALDASGTALVSQLTDVGPKKPEVKLTDSQKFIRDEEEKLIEFLKEKRDEKKRAEEKKNKTKLPALELQDRQSALDLMLSPDNTHVFVIISERRTGAKTAMVPNYVTETGYKTTCG
jgi:hypothetical protein